MKNFCSKVKSFMVKRGGLIAGCAFAFVALAANTPCSIPFYESEEPQGIERFKKFN